MIQVAWDFKIVEHDINLTVISYHPFHRGFDFLLGASRCNNLFIFYHTHTLIIFKKNI